MKINQCEKIQEFPKQYEDVFANENYCKKYLDINLVTTDTELGGLEYAKKLREVLLDYQKNVFDYIVKFAWLKRKFCYRGINRVKKYNGVQIDRQFSLFFLKYVGLHHRIISANSTYSKIIRYFNDFFPDFDSRDPFKEKLEYPYKNVSFEYLFFVYQMEERMELLKIAEERKMSYTEFLNYVINYICCLNEKEEKYWIKNSTFVPPYVSKKIDDKKYTVLKKTSKRK